MQEMQEIRNLFETAMGSASKPANKNV